MCLQQFSHCLWFVQPLCVGDHDLPAPISCSNIGHDVRACLLYFDSLHRMTEIAPNPFLSEAHKDTDQHTLPPVDEVAPEPEQSDGLAVFRRRPWYLSHSYTRADCRCGHCPWNDPEPCPYALPPGRSLSYLGSVKRRLSNALSIDKNLGIEKGLGIDKKVKD